MKAIFSIKFALKMKLKFKKKREEKQKKILNAVLRIQSVFRGKCERIKL